MSGTRTIDSVEAAAAWLEEHHGDHIAALLAYGSRVFGRARRGSAYDFWLIVKDIEAFHRANADFYRTELNRPSTPEKQIALNRVGPLFYSIDEGDSEIKIAVIGEPEFVDLCTHAWWTVKGRMQKPVRVMHSSRPVEEAILAARREAVACGVNLTPCAFTMDELLEAVVGLSYRAEVRPENKTAKVRSIVESGREPLAEIYRPLLGELRYIEADGDGWVDRRSDTDRRRARAATLHALKRSKWSRRSFAFVWRNFCSHGAPIKYILLKIIGEIEKALFGRKKASAPEGAESG